MSWRARLPLLVLGSLFAATGCGAPEPPEPSQAPRLPNIVLLISDDHGYPDHGFMGSERVLTPHLDRLAREGVAFSHGYSSANVCRPALATLLTGLEPLQLYLQEQQSREPRTRGGAAPKGSFAAGLETLPRLLAERGYATFQAGKHWEGSFRDAGFDEGMVDAQVSYGGSGMLRKLVRGSLDPVHDFLERNVDRPFFLWFAPLLPHLPHDAPERYRSLYPDLEGPAARYYAAISWLDDGIGQVVERIQQLGLEEHTLFVYLADNGWDPSAGDGASVTLGGPKGKLSPYELGFRTPLILRWTGGIQPQPLRSELVSFSDVFATLLDYAGASLPPGRHGHSLRPLVEGRAPWPRRDLVGWARRIRAQGSEPENARGFYFWRDARWRYVQPSGAAARLFDLEADPQETRDVIDFHPDVAARARARIEAWASDMAPRRKRRASVS